MEQGAFLNIGSLKMRINKEIIEKLNPCRDRFNNYLQNYADFDGMLEDFILLDNITYGDKVWVFTRLATKKQNVKWALLCASKVLSIFEQQYPQDKRPRLALEAVENYLKKPNHATNYTANTAYHAADAAANAATAAANAARAARAAAYAAYTAANAAYAAANAAYADVVFASNDKKIEQEVNLLFMVEAIKQ